MNNIEAYVPRSVKTPILSAILSRTSQSRTGVASTTFTQSDYNLSGAEADAITDYTSLFFRFVVNATT